MNKRVIEEDFVGMGFAKLDPRVVETRPPKIAWGVTYEGWDKDKKIEYLEAFSSSMNHAADLLQKEAKELRELCTLKEERVVKLNEAMIANNEMLQGEITRMNADRQGYNQIVAKLDAEIKELKDGNHD